MIVAEHEILMAVYEITGGRLESVTFDKIADHLDTTLTAVKSFSLVLQNRKLALVTFAGVQLTATGLEQARNEREIYSD